MQKSLSGSVSRRDFLSLAATGAAGLTLAAGCSTAGGGRARGKIPVGVQLYSVRAQCAQDLPGTLAQVAQIGYKGVEFAGYHGRSAAELRKLLDDLGLVCCGTHTPFESVQPDKLAETIEFNRILGNQFLIVPWMQSKTRKEWLDKARLFNNAVPQVQAAGMWIGYHAHAHDFHPLEGEVPWDLFFGNTRPEVVMQLDTSNCLDGGADPVAVLRKYPGRAITIHLKPNGGGPEAVIGEDKVDWPAVFQICETQGGTRWYIVEHESSKDPLDAIRRCFEGLKRFGKV